MAGTHEDSGNSYFQAFALANPVNAATITETAPTTEAQWFVVKNAQGQYSFMDKDGKFLAFVEKDGAYIVVDKKDCHYVAFYRYFLILILILSVYLCFLQSSQTVVWDLVG